LAVDRKYLKSLEMWCWGRTGKTSRTDGVRNEEVIRRVTETIIIHIIKKGRPTGLVRS